jgi:hypothetical protein
MRGKRLPNMGEKASSKEMLSDAEGTFCCVAGGAAGEGYLHMSVYVYACSCT